MDCADITVNGGNNLSVEMKGKELLIVNLPVYPIIPEGLPPGNDGVNLLNSRNDISVFSGNNGGVNIPIPSSLSTTRQPTRQPTSEPTRQPTSEPTRQSINEPTRQPTSEPTRQSINEPISTTRPRSRTKYLYTSNVYPSSINKKRIRYVTKDVEEYVDDSFSDCDEN